MLFLIIGLIAGIIAGVSVYRMVTEFEDGIGTRLFGVFLVCIFAVVGFMTGILAGGLVAQIGPHEFTTKRTQLAALGDSNQLQGRFFLGSGSIDSMPTYTFYEQLENGGNVLRNADADGVTVFQDSDRPYAVEEVECKTNYEWLAICIDDPQLIEFHVPLNSIKNNFVLDAE